MKLWQGRFDWRHWTQLAAQLQQLAAALTSAWRCGCARQPWPGRSGLQRAGVLTRRRSRTDHRQGLTAYPAQNWKREIFSSDPAMKISTPRSNAA